MTQGPDPRMIHPVPEHQRIVFLKPLIDNPRVEIGEYTYYDDPDAALDFERRNILHHYEELGDKLVVGRFCALATGVRFVMNGANHAMTGLSTYPFHIFRFGWEEGFDRETIRAGLKGDTVVGHDVWIGAGATIMPGVRIGDGAVVAAQSVVARDVAPYAVVGGNPAEQRRLRFAPETVARLLALAWWNWPIEKIAANLAAIRGGEIEALERAA